MEKSNHSNLDNSQIQGEGVRNILFDLFRDLYPRLRDSKGEEKQSVADRIIELLSQIPHGPGTSIRKIIDQYNCLSPGEFRAYQLKKTVEDYIEQIFDIYHK